jgi:hypothetical protein
MVDQDVAVAIFDGGLVAVEAHGRGVEEVLLVGDIDGDLLLGDLGYELYSQEMLVSMDVRIVGGEPFKYEIDVSTRAIDEV